MRADYRQYIEKYVITLFLITPFYEKIKFDYFRHTALATGVCSDESHQGNSKGLKW